MLGLCHQPTKVLLNCISQFFSVTLTRTEGLVDMDQAKTPNTSIYQTRKFFHGLRDTQTASWYGFHFSSSTMAFEGTVHSGPQLHCIVVRCIEIVPLKPVRFLSISWIHVISPRHSSWTDLNWYCLNGEILENPQSITQKGHANRAQNDTNQYLADSLFYNTMKLIPQL